MRTLQEADDTSFDIANWCDNPSGTEALADCAVLQKVDALQNQVDEVTNGLNIFFLLFAGSLVIFMQCGFAMVCAGSVRAKNVKNTLLKMFVDTCTTSTIFFATGYAFAYGGQDSANPTTFIGSMNFFLSDAHEMSGLDLINFFFQLGFAANCTTIVCCAIVERSQFVSYIWFCVILSGIVYPVVARSIWSPVGFLYAGYDPDEAGNGLFSEVGTIDLAGSGVVHLTGGVSALVGAIILGPRIGLFYDEAGEPLEEPNVIPAHSSSLQMLGTFVLWFGWYGFNGGSALSISTEESSATAAITIVTTTLAAAGGGLSGLFMDSYLEYKEEGNVSYDPVEAMNGCLTALVGITAGCSVVAPWASVVIGLIAGVLYVLSSRLLLRLRIDDPVGGAPVHLVGGIWGLLAVGFFAEMDRLETSGYNPNHTGWFYSWGKGSSDATLLLAQFVGVVWIVAWTAITMTPCFLLLSKLSLFRVSEEAEVDGLDLGAHGGWAYDYKDLMKKATSNLDMPGVDLDMPEATAEEFNNSRHSHRGSVLKYLKTELDEEMKKSRLHLGIPEEEDAEDIEEIIQKASDEQKAAES